MPVKSNPIFRVLTSAKVHVAVGTVVGLLLTILNVGEEKRALWLAFIAGVFVLASAVIWAWGYEDGKANEGTVPDGRQPIIPPVQVNVTAPMPSKPPDEPPPAGAPVPMTGTLGGGGGAAATFTTSTGPAGVLNEKVVWEPNAANPVKVANPT